MTSPRKPCAPPPLHRISSALSFSWCLAPVPLSRFSFFLPPPFSEPPGWRRETKRRRLRAVVMVCYTDRDEGKEGKPHRPTIRQMAIPLLGAPIEDDGTRPYPTS